MTDTTPVTTRMDGSVAVITMDDGKANALGFDILGQVNDALDQAEADASAVVLAGRPGKFSAGFDLAVMTGGPPGTLDLLGRGAELGLRLFEFPQPVVLAVTGHALAMGGILLCCADVRIGAEGAFKLGLNEITIGMPVPGFAVELCRDRLSSPAFTSAVQLARLHSPTEARKAGFLDEVVDPGEVVGRSLEVAAELAERLQPAAFRSTRRITRGKLAEDLRAALAADLAGFNVSG